MSSRIYYEVDFEDNLIFRRNDYNYREDENIFLSFRFAKRELIEYRKYVLDSARQMLKNARAVTARDL